MFTEFNLEEISQAAMARANMTVEPRPMGENEPFHFSDTYRDVALRHVWTQSVAKNAREIQERGIPRWI